MRLYEAFILIFRTNSWRDPRLTSSLKSRITDCIDTADEVTDKRPIGKTILQLTLVNCEDGIDSTVNGKAPTGAIVILSKWRVYADRIEEDVSIDSNFVMNRMIKGNVEKSHPQQHLGFCQAAQA